MNLPKQVAPVERSLNPAPISGQNGVEASAWYDILKTVAQQALPIVQQLLG